MRRGFTMNRLEELENELAITEAKKEKALSELRRGFISSCIYIRLYNRANNIRAEINKIVYK